MSEKKLEKKTVPVTQHVDVVEEQKIDEKTKKREALVIYLLINYPEKSFERLTEKTKVTRSSSK